MLYRWKKTLAVPFLLTTSAKAFRPSHSFLRRSLLLVRAMSSSTADVIPGRPTWQQTMLRIKDPQKTIPFYESLGFTLIDSFDFPQYKFSLYFMTTLPQGETYNLKPGTQAAHDYLWNMRCVALELTHNHGTESDAEQSYHTGNQEKDGFGHIAVNVDDVYETCSKLEKAGVTFKKKPDEGRMKGVDTVAFCDGHDRNDEGFSQFSC